MGKGLGEASRDQYRLAKHKKEEAKKAYQDCLSRSPNPEQTQACQEKLKLLAEDAHKHGDDYVLEPFINYEKTLRGNETLNIIPSAHIRWGEVAPGVTLQFTEGTSWKGNIYVDEQTATSFGISDAHYQTIRTCMDDVLHGFHAHQLGLTIAGLDFAIGRIGQSLFFEMQGHDPQVLAGAVGVLVLVALASALVPATRAARVDPMVALRDD